MRALLAFVLPLLSINAALAHTPHPPSPAVTGNGLSTQVLFIGADANENRLTVSVKITNTANAPAYLAIVGPAPTALDTRGGAHKVSQIASIARCQTLDNSRIDDCIRNNHDVLPGTAFTLLPPQVPTLLNIELKAKDLQPKAIISFTMNAAIARNSRPANRRSSDPKLEYINIHLPPLPVNGLP